MPTNDTSVIHPQPSAITLQLPASMQMLLSLWLPLVAMRDAATTLLLLIVLPLAFLLILQLRSMSGV